MQKLDTYQEIFQPIPIEDKVMKSVHQVLEERLSLEAEPRKTFIKPYVAYY